MRDDVALFLVIFVFVWLALRALSRRRGEDGEGDARSNTARRKTSLTREGKIFFIFANLVLLSGLQTGVNFIYLTFALLGSALILSLLVILVTVGRLSISLRVPPEVTVGEPFHATITLKSNNRFFPTYCLKLKHDWPKGLRARFDETLVLRLRPGQSLTIKILLVAGRRGAYSVPLPSWSCGFPFGFVCRETESIGETSILALPRLGHIHWGTHPAAQENVAQAALRLSRTNLLDDFSGLREFRTGDSPNWIHWKTSARLRQLMVRESMATNAGEVAIVLSPSLRACKESQNEEAIERGISFAATLARDLVRRNYAVRFIAHGRRQVRLPGRTGLSHLDAIWRELALYEPCEESERCEDLFDARAMNWRVEAMFVLGAGADTSCYAEVGPYHRIRSEAARFIDITSSEFDRMFTLAEVGESLEACARQKDKVLTRAGGLAHEL